VEVKVLVLHGILHLAGFDHERDNGQMARKEATLRRSLRLPSSLTERGETGSIKSAGRAGPRLRRAPRTV
jgi:probable rRNA maturation factor